MTTNALDKFFLELKQKVTIAFIARHCSIKFSRRPDTDAVGVCQRIATSPGFRRLRHRRCDDWESDTMEWFIDLPAGISRVPLAKALLESFQELGLEGVVEFTATDMSDDPTYPFDSPPYESIFKTLVELSEQEGS